MNGSNASGVSHQPLRVALAAMPWPLLNRPSIQLGALKAYLDRQAGSWLNVDLFHPYVAVGRLLGTELYHWLCLDPWASEALYAPLLFPDRRPQAAELVRDAIRKAKEPIRIDFTKTSTLLQRHLDNWIAGTDWASYDLVGFSISFNQLFSSLAAASRLKEQFPELRIVIGGSFCAPQVSASLLNTFPFVEYAVQGEGERPLLELCRFLSGKRKNLPAGVLERGAASAAPASFCQVPDLSDLPPPDYREYFIEIGRQFQGEPFIPVLPVEFSRGCWWGRCAFCNLNLQWRGYRTKNASTMKEEVFALSRKFCCLDFAFTDNALPPAESLAFFGEMADRGKDVRFFGEIRVQRPPEEVAAYRRGGLRTVQAGIEALSSSLLRRMGKGTTVFDNISAIRHCLASGIELKGNLITEFPGSTGEEVEETLRNLDFILPFPPLVAASFFLGHGSPVARAPDSFGIRSIRPHRQYARLIPRDRLAGLTLLISDYRGDRSAQRRLWAPLLKKIKQWKQFHHRRAVKLNHEPALGYREGGNFLIIRQELTDRILYHRLRGRSREIYLFCEKGPGIQELCARFPSVPEAELRKFLEDLRLKRLMFTEDDRYLSLAVREQ